MKKAFTLIEAILVIMIIFVTSTVIGFYIREGAHAWKYISGQKSLSLASRAALNRVTRELRRAKKNTNITTFTSKEVTFLDADNNTVTFSQSGRSLLLNSDILLSCLQDPCGLKFTYLNRDGNETSNHSQIATIRCRLTGVSDDNKFVIESSARIRIKKLD